tara:strand:- start:23 stop:232 length:210 start_codon:yes stop_codon:yes gene_type:complete
LAEEEKIVVDEVEHKVEDLNADQKYMIAQIKDLQLNVSRSKFALDQAQAALNVFTNTLSKSFQPKEEEK